MSHCSSHELPDAATVLSHYAPAAGLSYPLANSSISPDFATFLDAHPFLMAPMAGVSDAAWRIMARAGGAALAYTEMVSATGLHYASEKTWELVLPHELEPSIAVQLFGSEPARFEEAVAAVAARVGDKLALIDINMACPVPKVTKKGEGSALLDEPERAAAIVRACKAQTVRPITVKIRSGRRPDAIVAPEFCKVLEAAGADAVAVHGRSAAQLYRGSSDDAVIARCADAVRIPIIASGDVMSAERALELMRSTAARGVFIARGSYGSPWIFSDAQELYAQRTAVERTLDQRLAAFCCHVCLLEATGAHIARARNLSSFYFKHIPNASSWRARAMKAQTANEFISLAQELATSRAAAEYTDVISAPNNTSRELGF